MNCGMVEEHLEDFLDDRLSEPDREEVRAHLMACSDCRALSKSHPVPASDFKKLNHLSLPDSIRDVLEIQKRQQAVPEPPVPAVSLKWIVPAALVFVVLLFLSAASLPYLRQWASSPAINSKVIEQAEPAALRELKMIARRLGIRDVSGENPQAGLPAPALQKGVSVKPLHIHLDFSKEGAKADFARELNASGVDASFRSPDFWVVSLNHDQLVAMLDYIKTKKIPAQNLLVPDGALFPDFEGLVRVSIFLHLPVDPGTLALSQHWHLSFHIPNRYSLLDKLQELNIKLTYQSAEVWVFDVPAPELKGMMKIIDGFAGVKADYGAEGILPDAPGMSLQVAVYLKEA